MLLCLGMASDAAAAHRHEFSPLSKSDNEQQKPPRPSLPYFFPSYSKSHASLASSTSSAPASERSDVSVGSTNLARVEGRFEYEASSKASSTAASGFHAKGRKRSASKNKTSFQLAHPPPAVRHRQRFSIRPRLLLQLQQISGSTRPVPALDVLPSVTFAPRLAKKFPRLFKGKDGLGPDDLVIVRSQTYDAPGGPESKGEKSSDSDWNNRDIVAAFCQVREGEGAVLGNTEICLNHGASWEATSTANGAYEFTSTSGEGQRTVARWVPKPLPGRQRSVKRQERLGMASPPGIEKFNFSIINPDSRRHPVIASLTPQSLSICDRYSVPSAPSFVQASASPGISPIADEDFQDMMCNESNAVSKTVMETDEHLKTLVVITGLWVAFREGYSPNFRYNNPMLSSLPAVRAQQQIPKSHPRRSLSLSLGNLSNSRASNSEEGKQKRGSQLRPGITPSSSTSAVSTLASPTSVRSAPRRANSAGTAFLNRVNNRNSSSVAMSTVQSPIPVTSLVSSHEEKEWDSHSNQRRRRSHMVDNPTASPNLRQRHALIATNRESSYRNSLTTISDFQSSGESAAPMDANGDKSGKLNKLFGFLRRTSGAHK